MSEKLEDPSIPGASLLSRVDIVTGREGGIVEAYVPIDLIDQEDVPVDARHVEDLARSMESESTNGRATGQLSPVLVGYVSGQNKFIILDGFHRTAAIAKNGGDKLYCTIKRDCTANDIIDIRIVSAKSHKGVKFSRIVEWVGEAWAKTPWAETIDVGGAFTMALLEKHGSKNRGLTEEEANEVKQWIRQKCTQWDVSVNYIDKYLRTAKVTDPALVKRARDRTSGNKLVDITPAHLNKLAILLPNQYDLQHIVADAAVFFTLTVAQTEALALAVSKAKDYETIARYLDTKVWIRMGAASQVVRRKRYREIDLEKPGDYTQTLVNKFFDDQVELAELLIENAILLGLFTPNIETSSPELNALVIARALEETDMIDEYETSETTQWDPKKVHAVAERAFALQAFLRNVIKRRFKFNDSDAEDVISITFMKFLTRVNDGRLPDKYIEETHLRRLLAKIAINTSIDEIRKAHGGNGHKQSISLDEEIFEGQTLGDTLGQEEAGFEEIVKESSDYQFMRNLLPFLSERQRRTLILKGYFKLNSYEIAKVLGTSEGTINQEFRELKTKAIGLAQRAQLSLVDISR